jgi:diguanylate cyclase (GGDEF)-like protein/PAS domain S-box-containing protein
MTGTTVQDGESGGDRAGQQSVRQLIDRLPGAIYRVLADHDWTIEYISAGCKELAGYDPEYFVGNNRRSFTDLIHGDDRAFVFDQMQKAMEAGGRFHVTYRIIAADGTQRWLWEQGCVIKDATGAAIAIEGYITDVTLGKETENFLRHSEAKMREQAELLDQAREAIIVRETDHRIRYWNKGAERLYGWTSQEVLGRSARDVLYDETGQFEVANKALFETGAWSGEIRQRRKDGSSLTSEAYWTLVRDADGRPISIFSINNDISKRKEAEARIQRLAYFDTLTGLPNRPRLLDRLRHFLDISARSGSAGALMFLDLDRFKLLNDTMGHDVGDIMLQQVARRLLSCVRHSDTVARFGGDEFVILLESLDACREKAARQAEQVAEKILAAFTAPFQLDAHQHFSSPSIGIVVFTGGQDKEEDILKRADMAMYQAKAAGRNNFRFFDMEMQNAIVRRAAFEAELRRGSLHHEFLLYYQPQVDRSSHMTGVEALLRWQPEHGGVRNALAFISVAEDSDLILQLGQWALETACQQIADWAAAHETARLTVSVNVSLRQFRHPAFVPQLLDMLESTGADPCKLTLELAESVLLKDIRATEAKMNLLRMKGVRFSLDDFGTGASSLSYLRSLPFDELKIDQSFVGDVETNLNDARIASSIIALGNSLGLRVIAEGVETVEQREFLASRGCHAYQGYLFGLPAPAERILESIRY